MNRYAQLGLASLILASNIVSAAEPAPGWYAGLMFGASKAPSTGFTLSPPFLPFPVNGKVTYDIGGDGGLQVGYRCNYFRFEGQLFYNYNGYDTLTVGGITIKDNNKTTGFIMNGHTSFYAGFFNAYYEMYEEGTDPNWVPYIGLGIGYTQIQNQLKFFYNNVTLNRSHNTRNTSAPIGQAILGLNYFFSDEFSTGIDLRYMTTNKVTSSNDRISAGSVNLVLNYTFDQGY